MWGMKEARIPGRPTPGTEIDEELEFHLEMRTEELMAEGFPKATARRRAEAEFGDLEGTRRYCREQDRKKHRTQRLGSPFRVFRDELFLAARAIARRPGSVMAPVAILALAVALNTLVLTVVRGVLLSPLPFLDADRVAAVEEVVEGGGLVRSSYPVLDAWRRESRQVEAMAAFLETRLPLQSGSGPIHVEGVGVTEGFFQFLSNPLRMGRPFNATEHRPGGPPVAAVSEGLWHRVLGSDPQVLGRLLELDGEELEVVAVVRDDRAFPDGAEIWVPVERANPELLEIAGAKIFRTLARLRPGATLESTAQELAGISARVPGGAPEAAAVWLKDRLLGDVRTPLLLLQGAVLLVLLAGAANAGSLLLARGVRRKGEVALRASLGAGGLRVTLGLLLEGLLLGGAAGMAGLLLAQGTLGPALALVPVDLPRAALIRMDPWVAVVAMTLAVLTGLATALVPALVGARTPPAEALRESSPGSGTPPWIRVTLEGFVVAQIALAVVLTAGAGLLVRSFIATVREHPGFDPSGITLVDLSLPDYRYPDPTARVGFARQLLAGAAGLPGARAVALGRNLPISGSNMTSPLQVEGSSGFTEAVQVVTVTEGYFDVLQLPILEGRIFTDLDRPDSPPALLVDLGVRTAEGENLSVGDRAHSFFGGQEFREVVGVAGPVRHGGLRSDPVPIVYEPFFQRGGAAGFTLLIHSEAPPGIVAAEARRLVNSLDPELPVDRVTTMDARISRSLAGPRFYTLTLSLFGFLAVLLSLAGCQAGLAHRVAAHRREIAIRVALGASSSSVRGMVLGRGLFLTAAGMALGFLTAVPGTRLLESQLYGVGAGDPLTFGLLLLLLLGAGTLASDFPARRAAKLDPAKVLKEE